jgi:hypothetical protein
MLKLTEVFTLIISLSLPIVVASTATAMQKDPCLKNNNGIGNNHDIYVELPTNSLSLNDSLNQMMSIRIDPGNNGQMALFKNYLSEQGFDSNEEIEFAIEQVVDAEMKVKQNNLQCQTEEPVDRDYTLFPD